MKSKLTLRLESALINRAKKYAEKNGTSVSQLVADYFALIEQEETSSDQELPPITASLSGILKDTDIKKEDYKTYLEDKYLK